ncbi:DUF1284 domain-containing protein [Photorhabdus heterorhabditis]|uniref:2Fe-2S ferredoxin n=1 Tax=Photorhabdus heterorhabditis TaxID=880156 RepID=A0A5B0XA68_9GAMM|nr:DUF1284 domain-containing protein [Photorhabdus heterorhabditis]KAA1195438.1 DUF1284 domain-containing protein [Photorhabdus heterorhabditis]KOY62441.1 2Fe-2S ferredoxin [Photorhabdus heterorhabditis]MBS9441102.1 DUF1284 domain-containing protein [Photorhabdus heterorhabditis]NRN27815.1 DUF1284 domain-containing protein [Photorhabdus heterorhabditis subsp. aluminescens]
MTISLRGHHLLCILTYAGNGYSPSFIENYNKIIPRIRDEDILIVAGPDDICMPLLGEDAPHCLGESVIIRDSHALEAVSTLMGWPVEIGHILRLDSAYFRQARWAFRRGIVRAACVGCEWEQLCTRIAVDDYASTFLKGSDGKN